MSSIKTGRPTKYDPKYCEELINHMARGLSYESFAGFICVAISTIYKWEKEHPEFSEAKKEGQARSMYSWELSGIKGMHSKNPFNASVWIFNMKNRFNWRDRVDNQVSTGEQDEKLVIEFSNKDK